MNIPSYVPEYEKMTGEKVSPSVIRFFEELNVIGQKFERKGREDAANGLQVPSDDAFQEWGKKVFYDDPEMAESMGDLMQLCYMDGYEAGINPGGLVQ